ncbi:hypothetical protein PC114_g25894 [Phytophthora cactorum]|nr:hypothetical protein PC114_g25894 [Phytophthora cactorum]
MENGKSGAATGISPANCRSSKTRLDKQHDAAASGGNSDDGDVVDKRSRGDARIACDGQPTPAVGTKGVEGVEYGALQESWCAFIWRWNRMVEEDDSFVGWLVYREEIIKDHSLSELRERVCSGAGKTCAASAT